MSCCKCQNTFAGWAVQIGLLTGRSVSKQAVFDRIHKGATAFAQELLQRVLLQQSGKGFVEGLFSAFGKVLLQDSTTLKLPQSLSKKLLPVSKVSLI
jgi:c-di-GMP-related signal transduction protein